ncbi:MAG: hypothetical protein ACI9A2_003885 [Halioglobus sp.]|jgi:hypothetical protein
MKAEVLNTQAPQNTEPSNQEQKRSASLRYVLAVALLLVVYFISSWSPAESESMSLSIAPGFLLFWLAGGSLTLGILAKAAKKKTS